MLGVALQENGMFTRSLIAIALTIVPAAALAHHGWSTYDPEKKLKVTAPLTNVGWSNPHGSAKIMWQKAQWDVVLAPVARMEARGLTQQMLSRAKAVTLEGWPRSDGTREMKIERITIDGKVTELR
jgi:hypothetical protein